MQADILSSRFLFSVIYLSVLVFFLKLRPEEGSAINQLYSEAGESSAFTGLKDSPESRKASCKLR
jgi:hypothetical protein